MNKHTKLHRYNTFRPPPWPGWEWPPPGGTNPDKHTYKTWLQKTNTKSSKEVIL